MKKLQLHDDRNRWLLYREHETEPGIFADSDDLYHRLELYNLVGIDDTEGTLAVAEVSFLTFSDDGSDYQRGILGNAGDPHPEEARTYIGSEEVEIHNVWITDGADILMTSRTLNDKHSALGSYTHNGVTLTGNVRVHFSQVAVDGLVKDSDIAFSRIIGNVSIVGSKIVSASFFIRSDEASIIAVDYLEEIVVDYEGEKGLKIIEPEDCRIVLSQEFYDEHKAVLSEYVNGADSLKLLNGVAQSFNVPLQVRVRLSDDTYHYLDLDTSLFGSDHSHTVFITKKEG